MAPLDYEPKRKATRLTSGQEGRRLWKIIGSALLLTPIIIAVVSASRDARWRSVGDLEGPIYSVVVLGGFISVASLLMMLSSLWLLLDRRKRRDGALMMFLATGIGMAAPLTGFAALWVMAKLR